MTGSRVRKIAVAGVLLAGGVASFLALWAFWWEPDRLSLRRVTLELAGWPASHGPLRVGLLSDLHAGAPFIDAAKIEAAVDLINRAQPDAVLLLGDYVIHGVLGGTRMDPAAIGPLLKELKAPLGVFAVLGNHDWWDGHRPIEAALNGAGARFVDNQIRKISRADGDFWLLGIGDAWEGDPEIEAPLAAVRDGLPVIAMTHNPDVFPAVPNRVALTIAGHTHGGQVALPLLGRPIVPSAYGERFAYGHIVEGSRELFVTSGLGTSILPVRFRVPPEVVLLTIRAPR